MSPSATNIWKSFLIQRRGNFMYIILGAVNSLWDGPQWSQPLALSPCTMPFPSERARPADSILIERIQQSYGMPIKTSWWKDYDFCPGLLGLLCHLLAQRGASCHAMSFSLEKPRRQGTESTAMQWPFKIRLSFGWDFRDDTIALLSLWIQPCMKHCTKDTKISSAHNSNLRKEYEKLQD